MNYGFICISHIIILTLSTLVFTILFAALVLFLFINIKILIYQIVDLPFCWDKTYPFNILKQILLYIKSVHDSSFLIACYILFPG